MKKILILTIITAMFVVAGFSMLAVNASDQANIRIIIVHYSGADEYVEFINDGDQPVNMKGMQIVSGTNKQEYIFDDLVLEPLEIFKLHSGPQAMGLVWTYDYVHRDTTDGVLLFDKNGKYVSSYRWGR